MLVSGDRRCAQGAAVYGNFPCATPDYSLDPSSETKIRVHRFEFVVWITPNQKRVNEVHLSGGKKQKTVSIQGELKEGSYGFLLVAQPDIQDIETDLKHGMSRVSE